MPFLNVQPMTKRGIEVLGSPKLRNALRQRIKNAIPYKWPKAEGDTDVNFLYSPPDSETQEGAPDIIIWGITTERGRFDTTPVVMDIIWMCCGGGESDDHSLIKASQKDGWECPPEESLYQTIENLQISFEVPMDKGGIHRFWVKYPKRAVD